MEPKVLKMVELFLQKNKRRKQWHSLVKVLACLVVFCTTYALILPAITMSQKPHCGIEEHKEHNAKKCYEEEKTLVCDLKEGEIHKHGDACYELEKELSCGQTESEGHQHTGDCYVQESNLSCGQEESEDHQHDESCYTVTYVLACGQEESEGHAHSDACYTESKKLVCKEAEATHQHSDDCYKIEKKLVCKKKIHEHEKQCFSDPKADVETKAVWEKSLSGVKLTGNWGEDVIAVAKTQLGYEESTKNYKVTEDGKIKGYTRYGAWYGNPYGDWCAMFASFCLNYAGVDKNLMPQEAGCENWIRKLSDKKLFEQSGYEPETGDLIFFDLNNDSKSDHVGLVVSLEKDGKIKTIEGNSSDRVEYNTYALTDGRIMGYGKLPEKAGKAVKTSDSDEECAVTYEMAEETVAAVQNAETTSLDVSPYIVASNDEGNRTMLTFKSPGENTWQEAGEGVIIPGDASVRIDIVYKDVPINTLQANGNTLFYEVPSYMKDVNASGTITSGQTVVGRITASSNSAYITFTDAFLEQMKASGNTKIDGTFFVEARLDITEIQNTKPGSIQIGGVNVDLNFDGDILAKYGTVDVDKNIKSTRIEETAEGDFVVYTITVTAGEDGCPQVRVTDAFSNTQYVTEYVGLTGTSQKITAVDGVTEEGAPAGKEGSVYLGTKTGSGDNISIAEAGSGAQKPGMMVWEIGDMGPNETRTLEYRVKLKDTYTGVQASGRDLQNTANVYSKTFPRDDDTNTFSPNIGTDERKYGTSITKNADGTSTIHYRVWFRANDNNSYTLDNIRIDDRFNYSNNTTDSNYLQYLSYDTDSFELYRGSSNNASNAPLGEKLPTPENPHAGQNNPAMKADGKGFDFYAGDLAPGDAIILTYDVIVQPGFFTTAGNTEGIVKNRAQVHYDDTRSDATTGQINAWSNNVSMGKKMWDRKLVGDEVTTDTAIAMSGEVYDATGSSVTQITNPESSFVVAAGSYGYTVLVNEAGDWDVSHASMKDTLGNNHMQFVGYVRVDAYEIAGNAPGANQSDEQAAANLAGRSPAKTVWVKIDDLHTFNFTPSQVGLGDGEYAIRMTYYAEPVNMEGITAIVIGNNFNLSGTVGIGNYQYILGGIGVNGSVLVEGANNFGIQKKPWYYDKTANTGNYSTGTIYWVIEMAGSSIPAGTEIKDTTPAGQNGDHKGNELFGDSIVGVYKGSLLRDITDYKTYEAAVKNLEVISPSNYTVDLSQGRNKHELHLRFDHSITLNETAGEKVYVIVKTRPEYVPSGKRDAYYYTNELQHRFGDGAYIEDNPAVIWTYGSENILKELNSVITWDGKTMKTLQNGKGGTIITSNLEPGTYVAWNIKANYMGNLSGTYTITDYVPDGMELVYARIKWLGSDWPNRGNVQCSPKKTDLGASWEEHSITAGTDGCGNKTTWFYTSGNQVCWDVSGFVAGGKKDSYSCDCQVLCRVTDPDVLFNGGEKTFNNNVSLSTTDGQQIGHDVDGVTLRKQTLAKVGIYDPEVNGGRYPFQIKINDLSEDLMADSDTITLVDEMSSSLKLDVSSIVVKNTMTNTVLATDQYSVSIEGQVLKITVPDTLPLTITYEAIVQAAPGAPISISNNAHWEGYTPSQTTTVQISNFQYSAGGTVTGSGTPVLRIVKMDQYDIHKRLEGAKFTVREMELQNGQFLPKNGGKVWTDCTTNADGEVVLGRPDDANYFDWNKVYEIVETEAPEGYKVDATPHYFVVAKKVSGNYPQAELDSFRAAGATIYYLGAEYIYEAFNSKGEAYVEKKFMDVNGMMQTALAGKYTFGLYKITYDDNVEEIETLVDKKVLNLTAGATNTRLTFHNLDMGEHYKIYEMDDYGNPIKMNDANSTIATVDKKLFDVTYEGEMGNIIFLDDQGADGSGFNFDTVTVVNSVHYSELPATGGFGTGKIYMIGIMMMLAALAGMLARKRFVR